MQHPESVNRVIGPRSAESRISVPPVAGNAKSGAGWPKRKPVTGAILLDHADPHGLDRFRRRMVFTMEIDATIDRRLDDDPARVWLVRVVANLEILAEAGRDLRQVIPRCQHRREAARSFDCPAPRPTSGPVVSFAADTRDRRTSKRRNSPREADEGSSCSAGTRRNTCRRRQAYIPSTLARNGDK